MHYYNLLDADGNVIEKRCSEQPIEVGPGALGEQANMVEVVPASPTLSELKEKKLAGLAKHRYEIESGGIAVDGMTIKTDRESQAMLNGAQTFFSMNPAALVNWKAENGWVQIDAVTAAALAQAVAGHVQACFTNEHTHFEEIMALTTAEAIEAYDFTTGWPV